MCFAFYVVRMHSDTLATGQAAIETLCNEAADGNNTDSLCLPAFLLSWQSRWGTRNVTAARVKLITCSYKLTKMVMDPFKKGTREKEPFWGCQTSDCQVLGKPGAFEWISCSQESPDANDF